MSYAILHALTVAAVVEAGAYTSQNSWSGAQAPH